MDKTLPANTIKNRELTRKLEKLRLEFLELYTRHKDMVENDSAILTSVYLEKLGHLQLELLEKQTEASRLRMKMNMIQAAINRDEKPDLQTIDNEINQRLQSYYAEIIEQSAALDDAQKVLSALLSTEDTLKLKEVFRVLCKRLHPDLNPDQSEEEKDLFIKVKAAYDLQKLTELQNILLYLDDSDKENLSLIPCNDKVERIKHLEENISYLKDKISRLEQSFPFNIKDLISDESYITDKQEELRIQIKTAEEEIVKYSDFINIMCDE
jgi:hypothetical protein